METNKVLLRISNLKQYFPVGKSGQFVKANDGITLDIYEGETFGLVGESGCGKSTLGRSILQVYKQTDGRTLYFGRSVDELAPKYVEKTIASLEKRRHKMVELAKKAQALRAAYEKLSEKEQYAKHEELRLAEKEANDEMLDMATIIGGFLAARDLAPVKAIFMEESGFRTSAGRISWILTTPNMRRARRWKKAAAMRARWPKSARRNRSWRSATSRSPVLLRS